MLIHQYNLSSMVAGSLLLLSFDYASALTMREKWKSEEAKWRSISASVCVNCGQSRENKQVVVLIDPIAVLERTNPVKSKFAGANPSGVVVTAENTDGTLVPRYRKRAGNYAQLLKRRRYAKLMKARRYAVMKERRKIDAVAAQAGARAIAARNEIELGALRRVPQ